MTEADGKYIISIHAPRGGCDINKLSGEIKCIISIHAPRGGCDALYVGNYGTIIIFQSTHLAGGATAISSRYSCVLVISIHAPRGGCDVSVIDALTVRQKISIHAPRGGCDGIQNQLCNMAAQFQSTHPAGGATSPDAFDTIICDISIHAPRGGCDGSASGRIAEYGRFQSTHPAGGATMTGDRTLCMATFQSTHPAGGATMLMR